MRTAIISSRTVEFYSFPFIYSLFISKFNFKQIIIWLLSRFYMFLALWSLKLIEIYIFDNFALLYIAFTK